MPGGKPTVREILELNELIRLESVELQKVRAVLPMVGDQDLRQEMQNCVQTATSHIKAMVDFCKAQQLVQ